MFIDSTTAYIAGSVVMPMVAIWPMDVWLRVRFRSNRDYGFGFCFNMRMTRYAVRIAFRLKRLADLIDDQMHGAQHVSQHMVRFNFQVIGFEFNCHMAVTQVVSSAG